MRVRGPTLIATALIGLFLLPCACVTSLKAENLKEYSSNCLLVGEDNM